MQAEIGLGENVALNVAHHVSARPFDDPHWVEEVGSWGENSSGSGGIATRRLGRSLVDLFAHPAGTFRLRLAHRPIGI